LKVLITGDRNWNNKTAIKRELSKFPPETIIIHGGARGADKLAGEVAKELGFQVQEYPADWQKHGKAAGPIRNQEMLEKESPEYCIAFHFDLKQSKGTRDMVKRALRNKVFVKVVQE